MILSACQNIHLARGENQITKSSKQLPPHAHKHSYISTCCNRNTQETNKIKSLGTYEQNKFKFQTILQEILLKSGFLGWCDHGRAGTLLHCYCHFSLKIYDFETTKMKHGKPCPHSKIKKSCTFSFMQSNKATREAFDFSASIMRK